MAVFTKKSVSIRLYEYEDKADELISTVRLIKRFSVEHPLKSIGVIIKMDLWKTQLM